ncbi:hypothetical protein CDL15_Pgr011906 [Punica granatum]|uniref:Uncharacterized protein n=1 Tax=Punica granatum TaxID=22663 RepID=A0A218WDM8_PUNGR|nr:hypothetical protein CDL15_Pgr011906 [Punica granatum]
MTMMRGWQSGDEDPQMIRLLVKVMEQEVVGIHRTAIDPKVRQVSFFAPPNYFQSGPLPDPISAAFIVRASSSSPCWS